MYESLSKHCQDFHLYIFPFDDKSFEVLEALHLENVTLVPLKEFEDNELLSVKSSRSVGEYFWTSTSSAILYCIVNYNLDHCIYVDADIYFYNSPDLLLKEVEGKSILITDHRYSPQYNRAYDCGKYCVQFIYFRNDENGLEALKWWRSSCINWCYNRHEDGKFGDQKYLDDWMIRFQDVVELRHLGGGVAPWNIQQYSLSKTGEYIYIKELHKEKVYPLVFFHFHEFTIIPELKLYQICNYEINTDAKMNLYLPYIIHLIRLDHSFSTISNLKSSDGQITLFQKLKYLIKYFTKMDKNLIHID